jgi:hypothetical protein
MDGAASSPSDLVIVKPPGRRRLPQRMCDVRRARGEPGSLERDADGGRSLILM